MNTSQIIAFFVLLPLIHLIGIGITAGVAYKGLHDEDSLLQIFLDALRLKGRGRTIMTVFLIVVWEVYLGAAVIIAIGVAVFVFLPKGIGKLRAALKDNEQAKL